jgi:hypothetical protein
VVSCEQMFGGCDSLGYGVSSSINGELCALNLPRTAMPCYPCRHCGHSKLVTSAGLKFYISSRAGRHIKEKRAHLATTAPPAAGPAAAPSAQSSQALLVHVEDLERSLRTQSRQSGRFSKVLSDILSPSRAKPSTEPPNDLFQLIKT